MEIKQWTKLIVCVVVLVCTTLLLMFERIDGAAGVGIIMGVMGYVFGNGHAIVEQRTQELQSQAVVKSVENGGCK